MCGLGQSMEGVEEGVGRNEETQKFQIGEQERRSKTLGPDDFSVDYDGNCGNVYSYSRIALFSPAPYSTNSHMWLFNA